MRNDREITHNTLRVLAKLQMVLSNQWSFSTLSFIQIIENWFQFIKNGYFSFTSLNAENRRVCNSIAFFFYNQLLVVVGVRTTVLRCRPWARNVTWRGQQWRVRCWASDRFLKPPNNGNRNYHHFPQLQRPVANHQNIFLFTHQYKTRNVLRQINWMTMLVTTVIIAHHLW